MKLTPVQEDQLAELAAARHGIAKDELDGRTLRALSARHLARVVGGRATATNAGRDWLRHQRTAGEMIRGDLAAPRASNLARRIARLEALLPVDAEVQIGAFFAHVQDVLHGFWKLTRNLPDGRR